MLVKILKNTTHKMPKKEYKFNELEKTVSDNYKLI